MVRAVVKRTLLTVPTSVTGAELTVFTEGSILTLALDDHCQSEVFVESDGKTLSLAQPLELVQMIVLYTMGWLEHTRARGAEQQRVLLCGLGGGSIARVITALTPSCVHTHSIELEPEVLCAAADLCGLELSERCSAEAADVALFLKERAEASARGAKRGRQGEARAKRQAELYDVLILDAFTSEGLCSSVQQRATLDDAAACIGPHGVLIVNLHTGGPGDPDYATAKKVLRMLCRRFCRVYAATCASTHNIIAVCHACDEPGDGRALWKLLVEAQLRQPAVKAALHSGPAARGYPGFEVGPALERLQYVGGVDDPPGGHDLR